MRIVDFEKGAAMTVSEIARLLGGEVHGDASREIRGVASLENAGLKQLSFVEGTRAQSQAVSSRAGCILVAGGVSLAGKTTIAVAHPKVAFIRAAEALLPRPAPTPGIHPTAIISPKAQLAPDVGIGAHAVVEAGAMIGEGTRLDAGVFLGAGVKVGSGCIFHPRVTVYPGARIGNRVILHAGVVIGSDGFGYVFAEGRHLKFPQVGGVVIEDGVEIGSNSTVDRGSLGTTVIGRGTKIDNLVQIAHNVRIGQHCVIAAQTGISGSAEIGDYVVLAGQVGVADRVRIEDNAVVGAQAGILPGKVVRRGATMWGTPARSLAEFKKIHPYFAALPTLARKVKEIERQILK